MAAKKPQKTFTGSEGVASTGANGPEAIKTDITTLTKMFDPLQTHADLTPGGIHKDNLQASSGILTEDDDVILEDANGDLTVTRDVIAGRNVNAAGQMTATQFNGPLNGTAANAINAANATNAINAGNADTATELAGATGGKWVEVVNSTTSLISGGGLTVNLLPSNQQKLYKMHIYSPGITVYMYHPEAIGKNTVYLYSDGTTDKIRIDCSGGSGPYTFYYKVWAWD